MMIRRLYAQNTGKPPELSASHTLQSLPELPVNPLNEEYAVKSSRTPNMISGIFLN